MKVAIPLWCLQMGRTIGNYHLSTRNGCVLPSFSVLDVSLTHWGRDTMVNIFKCIFLNENIWIAIKISLNFVPKGLINNISALVQIITWGRPGNKPFSEPMVVSLPTHICVARPQWVKGQQFAWEKSSITSSLEGLPFYITVTQIHIDQPIQAVITCLYLANCHWRTCFINLCL